MAQVVYLNEANDDLRVIWNSIAKRSGSVEIAHRWIDKIMDTAELFAEQPESGLPRPDLSPLIRAFNVGDYIVFYRPFATHIEVTQVIHGVRDLPQHFRE